MASRSVAAISSSPDTPGACATCARDSRRRGGQHLPGRLAETDARLAERFGEAAQCHDVPVLEKRARLAVRQRDGLLAALRELEQGSEFIGTGTGLRAGTEQISRLQIASVHRVMRDELLDRPV